MHLLGEFSSSQEERFNEGLTPLGLRVGRIIEDREVSRGGVIVVRSGRPVRRETLVERQVPLVISAGSGTDNIEQWPGMETLVSNCRGGNGIEVAAHAASLLSAGYPEAFSGGRVGIVGAGGVGTQVSLLLRSFGIDTILGRRPGHEVDPSINLTDKLNEVLNAPVVILAVGEKGLINEDNLGLLNGSRVVINVGRGNVIDERAMWEMLARGTRYLTDVWPQEPKPGEAIPEVVVRMVNEGVMGTMHEAPHVSSSEMRIAGQCVEKIREFLESGKLPVVSEPIERYRQLIPGIYRNGVDLDVARFRSPDVIRVRALIEDLRCAVFNPEKRGSWQPKHRNPVVTDKNRSLSFIERLKLINGETV